MNRLNARLVAMARDCMRLRALSWRAARKGASHPLEKRRAEEHLADAIRLRDMAHRWKNS